MWKTIGVGLETKRVGQERADVRLNDSKTIKKWKHYYFGKKVRISWKWQKKQKKRKIEMTEIDTRSQNIVKNWISNKRDKTMNGDWNDHLNNLEKQFWWNVYCQIMNKARLPKKEMRWIVAKNCKIRDVSRIEYS